MTNNDIKRRLCPKCNSRMELMVDVTMIIPEEMESNLTKKNISRKGVRLFAANWPRARLFCKNAKCGWAE